MNETQIESIDNFEKFVDAMELDTKYLLPENCRYKWIRIEKGKDYYSKEIYYSWAMEYNYKVAGTTGYIYPLAGGNKVSTFKTEKGAKKNLIKKYDDYFNSFQLPNKITIL